MNQGEMKPQGKVEMQVIRGTGPRMKPLTPWQKFCQKLKGK